MMDDWTGLSGPGPEARRVRGQPAPLHLQCELNLNVWIIEVQPQFFFSFTNSSTWEITCVLSLKRDATQLHREANWPEGHPKWHKTTAEWYKMTTKRCKITQKTQNDKKKTTAKRHKVTTKAWNDTTQPEKGAKQPQNDYRDKHNYAELQRGWPERDTKWHNTTTRRCIAATQWHNTERLNDQEEKQKTKKRHKSTVRKHKTTTQRCNKTKETQDDHKDTRQYKNIQKKRVISVILCLLQSGCFAPVLEWWGASNIVCARGPVVTSSIYDLMNICNFLWILLTGAYSASNWNKVLCVTQGPALMPQLWGCKFLPLWGVYSPCVRRSAVWNSKLGLLSTRSLMKNVSGFISCLVLPVIIASPSCVL